MSTKDGSSGGCGHNQLHEIRLQGHLDSRWAESLQGMTFTFESGGTTLLTGPLMDQAALHGLLARIRDLGLPIVSLRRIGPEFQTEQKEGQA